VKAETDPGEIDISSTRVTDEEQMNSIRDFLDDYLEIAWRIFQRFEADNRGQVDENGNSS